MLLAVGALGFGGGYGVNALWFDGAAPVQPISFSHKLHAGEHKLPCQHCHLYAERSPVAGVPPMSKCLGCHRQIATDSPEIQKLMAFWQRGEPVPWLKVHDLPDFTHFSHKRHVRAGLPCQSCHGPVESMDVLTRVAPMTMGWCLGCHRERAVRFGTDCWTCHK
ncbi:MAG: cytochrome c3 family protein [Gammaproteobacteria bacterium]|nr:cytochrome c3 family protein [Gammaproteobacteria bacterium]